MTMSTKIKESIITITSGIVASTLADEVVILNLNNGQYYGVEGVGVRIWELLQQPQTPSSLIATITSEYEVEEEECRNDVLELLNHLREAGIVVFDDIPIT